MATWPFRRSRAKDDAQRLLGVVTQISRQPGLYGAGRVPDTLDGRLEAMILHAGLALIRLKREPDLGPLAQNFADALFSQFDAGLREAAVGDTAVPKKMHVIAGQFYGRLEVYAQALEAQDGAVLAEAIGRNVFGDPAAPFATTLARYAANTAATHAAAPAEGLFRLDGWRPAPA